MPAVGGTVRVCRHGHRHLDARKGRWNEVKNLAHRKPIYSPNDLRGSLVQLHHLHTSRRRSCPEHTGSWCTHHYLLGPFFFFRWIRLTESYLEQCVVPCDGYRGFASGVLVNLRAPMETLLGCQPDRRRRRQSRYPKRPSRRKHNR